MKDQETKSIFLGWMGKGDNPGGSKKRMAVNEGRGTRDLLVVLRLSCWGKRSRKLGEFPRLKKQCV